MLLRQGSFWLVAFFCAWAAGCHPLGPGHIPAAKPDGWVADLSGLLSAEEVAELQRLGDAVNAKDGGALAVLTVDSTEGADPRQLATGVFNRWQLGSGRDDGILIFVARDNRAAEIVLGKGIDSDAEVAATDRIMQQTMVPLFREKSHAAAILAGAHACATEFFGIAKQPAEAMPGPPPPVPPRPWRRPRLAIWVPAGLLALIVTWLFVSFLQSRWERRRPRRCDSCRKRMVRLGEAEEDRHLTPGQQAEELAGSVDYDIWACLGCGKVETKAYADPASRHIRCRSCNNLTALRSQKVVRPATQVQNGQVEVATRCGHCDHTEISTHEIPAESFYSGRAVGESPRSKPDLYENRTLRGRGRSSSDRGSGGSSSRGGGGSSSSGGGSAGRGSSGRW